MRRVALALIVTLVLVPFVVHSAAAKQEPIRIGVILPLTGSFALDGRYIRMGAEFAERFINDRGGVLGRPIKLIFEDDTATPSGAVLAYKLLVSRDKVCAVVGPYYSTMAFAVAPVAEELRVPFTTGSVNPQLTKKGYRWVFRTRATDEVTAAVAAEFVIRELKARRVAIIHDTDEYGRGAAEVIEAYLKENGITPVTVQRYTTGDKDFTGQVMAFLRSRPEVIIAWGHQTEAGIWLQQARELGVDAAVVGSSSYALPVFLQLAGKHAEGVYAVTEFVAPTTEQRPHTQEFIRLYYEAYKEYPEIFSSTVFDQVNVVVQGIRNAGSTDPAAIREGILSIKDYPSVVATLNYEPNGDCSRETLVCQIKDGRPTFLRRVTVPKQHK